MQGIAQSRIRKVLRVLAALGLVLAVILGVLLATKDAIFKSLAVQRIRRETGLEAQIGDVKVGLASVSVALKDVKVENPPGFGRGAMLIFPELHATMHRAEAVAGKLRFKELRFNLAELNVIRDTNGRVNLKELTWSGTLPFGGIDKLDLTVGQVNFTQLPQHRATIHLGIQGEVMTNLHTRTDVTNWAKAMLVRIALQEMLQAPTQPQGGGLRQWIEGWRQGNQK